MCICRCTVTHQKIWLFTFATLFLVCGIAIVIWWPQFATDAVYAELPLGPCSRTYDKWAVTPIPVYNQMYLFNWTNPEEVRTRNVKPNFQQLGPYVFREMKVKEDVTWHSNKTVTFLSNRTWFFDEKLSNGSLHDLVTCPHLPTIAAANSIRNEPKLIKRFFNIALNANGGALYQTHTAIEWLFDGFYDEFLDFAMKLNHSATELIKTNHFAWFLNRNGSKDFEGSFTIHTGQGDLTQMGELKFWNGRNHTGYFEDECGIINGSTADLFVPNQGPDEYITIYVKDTCRIINLEPTGEAVVLEGIEGFRYETTANTYDNGQRNPDMKCYCPAELQPDNCPKSGVTDMRSCSFGAPLHMSHPHFLYADPSYADTITGMDPHYERDSFFIIMERRLGVPLQVRAAVQISLLVQPDDSIDLLRGIPYFYAPMFITASKAVINKELAREVKLALSLADIGRDIGIAFIALASVLLVVSFVLTATHSWVGDKKPNNTTDSREQLAQESPAENEVNETS